MRNLIVSCNSLNNIMLCPRLHLYSSLMNLEPNNKPSYMEQGSLIHKLIEPWYKSKKDKSPVNINSIIDSGRAYACQSNINLTVEETEETNKLFLEYVNYYQQEDWIIEAIEAPFAVLLYESEKDDIRVIFQGKFDLLIETRQGVKCVVDHKEVSQNDRDPSSRDNQILGYCFAAKRYDFILNRIGKQKSLKISERMTRSYFNISKHQIEEWQESAIYWSYEILRQQELEIYPANYKSCKKFNRKCWFHEVCQAQPDDRERKLSEGFKVKTYKLFPSVLEEEKP